MEAQVTAVAVGILLYILTGAALIVIGSTVQPESPKASSRYYTGLMVVAVGVLAAFAWFAIAHIALGRYTGQSQLVWQMVKMAAEFAFAFFLWRVANERARSLKAKQLTPPQYLETVSNLLVAVMAFSSLCFYAYAAFATAVCFGWA